MAVNYIPDTRLSPRQKDIRGNRYGRLTALSYAGYRLNSPQRGEVHPRRSAVWACQCDCGETTYVDLGSLTSGNTRSCGSHGFIPTTYQHGYATNKNRHPLYETWNHMRARCLSPQDPNYPNYGGRGITVCQGWRGDIARFVEDVGPRPIGHSIDRIDNNGGYWCGKCEECIALKRPSNWRWATPKQQAQNKRNVKPICRKCIQRLGNLSITDLEAALKLLPAFPGFKELTTNP